MHNSLANENVQNQVPPSFVQERQEAIMEFNGVHASNSSKNRLNARVSIEQTSKKNYLPDNVFESHDHSHHHLITQSFNNQNNHAIGVEAAAGGDGGGNGTGTSKSSVSTNSYVKRFLIDQIGENTSQRKYTKSNRSQYRDEGSSINEDVQHDI